MWPLGKRTTSFGRTFLGRVKVAFHNGTRPRRNSRPTTTPLRLIGQCTGDVLRMVSRLFLALSFREPKVSAFGVLMER